MLPTQRLSPKNQVTIPREARALLLAGEVDHVRGMTHGITRSDTQEKFPLVLLMTEKELQRREQKILDDQQLSPQRKMELVTDLNGSMCMMSIDAQHRIVLAAHLVSHLQLERDIFFVCTNTTIQVWKPDDYLRWSRREPTQIHNPDLNAYLMI